MCRAFEEVCNEALQRGEQLGRLNAIRALMKNMDWPAEQAMRTLGIPPSEQPQYVAAL